MPIKNIEITHTNSISLVLNFCPSAPPSVYALAYEVYQTPTYRHRLDSWQQVSSEGPGPANGLYTSFVQMAAGDRVLCVGGTSMSGTNKVTLLLGSSTTALSTQTVGTKTRVDIPFGVARFTSYSAAVGTGCDVGYPNRRYKYVVATYDGTSSQTVVEGYIDVTQKFPDPPPPLHVCGITVAGN